MSSLDLVWTTRVGGGGRTERRYLDFVIDGAPLSSLIDADFISPFGWLDEATRKADIDRLLGKSPPDMAHGRTSLYICPECGDLGCGAVTVLIERGDHVVTWKNFGIQNNYEDVVHTERLANIGPFTFDSSQYDELLRKLNGNTAEILAEIAALPQEGSNDSFEGREHDSILYPKT